MKKAAIFSVYMGAFPSYHQFTLETMHFNRSYDWFILTDQVGEEVRLGNVRYLPYQKKDLEKDLTELLSTTISLPTPRKIADTKVCWGDLFKSLSEKYPWFGFTDLDCIYGNIDRHVGEALETHDVITQITSQGKLHGPFSLFRNEERIRRMYCEIDGLAAMINAKCPTEVIFAVEERCLPALIGQMGLRVCQSRATNGASLALIRTGKRRTPALWKNGEIVLATYMEDYAPPFSEEDATSMFFHIRPNLEVDCINKRIVSTNDMLVSDHNFASVVIPDSQVFRNHYHAIWEFLPLAHALAGKDLYVDRVDAVGLQNMAEKFGIITSVSNAPPPAGSASLLRKIKPPAVTFSFIQSMRSSLTRNECLPKRFVVTRGSRFMSPELLGVLKEKGFAEVRLEDHDILEQANLFYNAEMIVANHGAALANMIFADVRKTRILELNSGFNPTCFTRIHNQLALMLNVNPSRFNILFEDAIAERAITRSGGMGNSEWHTRFKHTTKQWNEQFHCAGRCFFIPKVDDFQPLKQKNFEMDSEDFRQRIEEFERYAP